MATVLPAKHQVVLGESLSSIALHYYGHGDMAHWSKIYEANKAALGDDPNKLMPDAHGKLPVLVIPAA